MGFERKAKAANILQTQETLLLQAQQQQAHHEESKLTLRAGSSNTWEERLPGKQRNNRPVW